MHGVEHTNVRPPFIVCNALYETRENFKYLGVEVPPNKGVMSMSGEMESGLLCN